MSLPHACITKFTGSRQRKYSHRRCMVIYITALDQKNWCLKLVDWSWVIYAATCVYGVSCGCGGVCAIAVAGLVRLARFGVERRGSHCLLFLTLLPSVVEVF
jgi:hypothetical protein